MDNNHFFRVVIFGFQNFYDMDFLDPKINSYAEAHTKAESKLLAELNRDTNANVLFPRMLSGHLQGRMLSMLSKMIQPKRILGNRYLHRLLCALYERRIR